MPLPLTYHDLVNHVVPGPQSLSYFATLALLPIALCIPPSVLSQKWLCMLFLPVMIGSTIDAWRCMGGTDVISMDTLLWSLYLLAFTNVRQDFRRLVKIDRGSSRAKFDENGFQKEVMNGSLRSPSSKDSDYEVQPYPPNLSSRLPWIGSLLVSLQLNNWKIRSPSHDSHQPNRKITTRSHSTFILNAILRTTIGYLLLDITAFYITQDPYFHSPTLSISSPLPSNLSSHLSIFPPLLIRTLILAVQSFALISQQFHLPCILPVSLHYFNLLPDEWSPHLWPPFFGSPMVVLTDGLRGFWGKYWHQTMRFAVAGPGWWVADHLLRLKKGGVAWFGTVTTIAFFASGLVHMGLVPREPWGATTWSANEIRVAFAGFFWLQPVGLFVELLVRTLGEKVFSKRFRTSTVGMGLKYVMNILWIAGWSCVCFPLLGDAGRQLGYFRTYTVPYSIVNGVLYGEWVMWPVLR